MRQRVGEDTVSIGAGYNFGNQVKDLIMQIKPEPFEEYSALEGVVGTILAVGMSIIINMYFRQRGQKKAQVDQAAESNIE